MKDHPPFSHQGPPEAPHTEPHDDRQAAPRAPRVSRRMRYTLVVLALLLLPVLLSLSGMGQTLLGRFVEKSEPPLIVAEEVKPLPPAREAPRDLTFANDASHPDRLFPPYFGDAPALPSSDTTAARLIPPFHELLDLFMKRQGEDGNFTIRVFDNRDMKLLELYTMVEAEQEFERTGVIDWIENDKLRSAQTKRLVAKYHQLGYPKDAISARWGRRHQVLEARQRELPLIEYEMRLARYLGLSLLATEIGTVETFNQDWMVSSAGARSRYQMMPYVLREGHIHRYKLQTAYGKNVQVREEWHPLLTMEPAFRLLRGYVNAVGHEIPGLSAYHTGPGNIFKIYEAFLKEAPELSTANTTVLDAYVWAVTEGFETISRTTSFRQTSQGYVPAGYGALRAVDQLLIDTTMTLRAERVQLKPDQSVYLSDLLAALVQSGVHLRWARGTASLGLYERFRRLNPHFDLPPAEADGGVPPEGNVLLVPEVDDATVRFFLPLEASKALADEGLDLLDETATFRFDHDTYRLPDEGVRTTWDQDYTDLVHQIGRFGFSEDHRERLNTLARTFDALAAADPSHYRLTQRSIIETHRRLWAFKGWDAVAKATEAARGKIHLHHLSPLPFDSTLRPPVRPTLPLERLAPRPPDADTSGTG